VEYVEELVKQAEKPAFALRDYKNVLYYEADLKGQVGVHHDLDDEGGPVWLRIDRLKRLDPPLVPEAIREWVTVSRDPFREPVVEPVRVQTMQEGEAAELIARGVVANDDVQAVPRTGAKGQVDVIFRLERFADAKTAVDQYISGPWREWAEAEKPRRRTIAIYDAYFSLQQAVQSDPEHPIEMVWGIGVSRWKVGGVEIDHPLLEQLVELDIESHDGAIRIRPRAVDPQLALRSFFELDNDGALLVREFGKEFLARAVDDKELSPFRNDTFAPILRQAATQLDTRGVYHPDQVRDITDRTVPPASENLIVSDTWAIYARQRSSNVLLSDLGRLKAAVDAAADLPSASTRLVTAPSTVRPRPSCGIDFGGPANRGTSSGETTPSDEHEEPEDFFFPKPFNDEQIAIIKRLGTADGMVVQGPPGTGKTHTIANIICHCLATGKRVLVTSKAAEPLVEVRNHIPEGIRDLVISLLSTEREGLRQLEQAVRILSNTAVRADMEQLGREIVAGQRRVAELRGKIKTIDNELRTWAEKHLTKISLGAGTNPDGLMPAELAEHVARERDKHTWLRDELDVEDKFEPLFADEDIAAARNARKALGADLTYFGTVLPSMADLPNATAIAGLHQNLIDASSLEERIARERLPALSMAARDAATRAESLLEVIEEVIEFLDATTERRWLAQLFEIWRRDGLDSDRSRLFNELIPVMSGIVDRRPGILRDAVGIPQNACAHTEVVEAVDKAARGKRPFSAIPFGKAAARILVQQIELQGRRPESTEDWQKVAAAITWHREISEFTCRWVAIKDDFDLPPPGDEADRTGRWIAGTLDLVVKARGVIEKCRPQISSELKELFPYGIEGNAIFASKAGAMAVAEILRLNLAKARLTASRATRADLIKRFEASSGAVVEQMVAFVANDVGNPDLNAQQVGDRWEALCRELTRIHNLRPYLVEVSRVADLIQRSGGVRWAQQLRTQPPSDPDDPVAPGAWRESWQWGRISGYLRRIDGRDRIRELSRLRLECEDDCRRTFSDVVKLRTYLGLRRNLTDRVQAALVMFTHALSSLGTGRGKRAARFRGDARKAMENCYSAVPCWIMPTWRVSEHLPAELGSFDLVIVDEASQSSIEALPALMRGTQLLIVGDDRQVSPTAAFIEERRILQLRHNYLKEQPFGQLLLPGSSLYSLANAVFPGTRIMLREHFRCVEPIIRFSFQFYPEPIIPLRIPKPSERLDPPLIDVHLPHGLKDRRKVNRVEAEAIVDEIEMIVKHPRYANRTIGVVSLIGAQQAYFIQEQLLDRIGEEVFHRHKIACGDSATFQGKERDIMFVSMVSSPGDGALTSQVFQQRFNVALSRARDRMYLFRSVAEETLRNPQDLRLKVIRHFKDPMPRAEHPVGELVDQCESGFERDVFLRLTALGYCVTPQVGVGAWRIDLVVEGENDRRLAIELDGDKWHQPEKWLDDMLRQRAMERMGWRFWRCWASSFRRDPDGCMADLASVLTALGIEPMAREARQNIHTEHRTVKVSTPRTSDSEPAATSTEPVVEIGDRVLVSYEDATVQQATLVVAAEQHDPSMGIFKSSSPTGIALLGAGIDDEVAITIGDTSRQATILAIDKPSMPGVSEERPAAAQRMVIEPNAPRDIVGEPSTPPAAGPSANSTGREISKSLSPRPQWTPQNRPVVDTSKPVPQDGSVPASTRNRNTPAPQVGTKHERILDDLRTLDSQFKHPRCPECGGLADLAINSEGPVVRCASGGCKWAERVDVQILQRLADHLFATCYQCKGTNLASTHGRFSNYLKCRDDGANNSWEQLSERIRKS
jgi:transcription elongation GreA/GreB family factor/very-short-patch-repair endonuclease